MPRKHPCTQFSSDCCCVSCISILSFISPPTLHPFIRNNFTSPRHACSFSGRPISPISNAYNPSNLLVATASSTWRHPRHLQDHLSGTQEPISWSESWPALVGLFCQAAVRGTCRARKRAALAKLLASAVLLAGSASLTLGYVSLNKTISTHVSDASYDSLRRDSAVGRLQRVSLPLRLHFSGLSLGSGVAHAPDVFVREVVVGVSKVVPAVFKRSPAVVSVSLVGPEVTMRQIVADGPLGKPVASWDLGIPSTAFGELEEVLDEDFRTDHGSDPQRSGSEGRKRSGEVMPMTDVSVGDSPARVSWVVPGHISVRSATVLLQPSEIPGCYGHGQEEVTLRSLNADLKLVNVAEDLRRGTLSLSGTATSGAGGSISVSTQGDIKTLLHLRPGDPLVDLKVKSSGVPARQVASFLNLPFRADDGICSCRLDVRFFYKDDEPMPEIHGSASVDGVAMRFHPDPTAPEFTNVEGSLRFVDRTMFVDGPGGDLGSLPMTVNGSIDLAGQGQFDLVGNVRSTDVNNVINTFDIDKFSPVSGEVKGEARVSGPFDEPFVEGWVHSSGQMSFDRVQLEEAKLEYEWEPTSGVLKFLTVSSKIVGGGEVSGQGGLYFDMTKITPYDVSRPAHHPRNPKSLLGRTTTLLPAPSDEMDIDLDAPARPYDSMFFEFAVRNVDGGSLVKWYGGPQGSVASSAIGLVSGDAVVAGHAKDANCRALWRSVSPPPPVYFADRSDSDALDFKDLTSDSEPVGSKDPTSEPADLKSSTSEPAVSKGPASEPTSSKGPASKLIGSKGPASDPLASKVPSSEPVASKGPTSASAGSESQRLKDVFVRTPRGIFSEARRAMETSTLSQQTVESSPMSFPGSDGLGGGEFRGAIFMKMGDLPAARRVKVRTTVTELDLRRLLWMDPSLREDLATVPAMTFSADTYYKGVIRQRVVPVDEASGENPRTPQTELLGVDGSLAVRGLRLNKFSFSDSLTGSFRANAKEVKFLLRERSASSTPEAEVQVDITEDGHGQGLDENSDSTVPQERTLQPKSNASSGPQQSMVAADSPVSSSPPSPRDVENSDNPCGKSSSPGNSAMSRRMSTAPWDELHITASQNGAAFFSMRRDSSEVVMSMAVDTLQKRTLSTFVRDFKVDDILGGNGTGMDGIPRATVGMDSSFNLNDRRGEGSFVIKCLRFGGVSLDRVSGDLKWRGTKILLRNAIAYLYQSEYRLEGCYRFPKERRPEDASWELNVVVPSADFSDLTGLLKSRRRMHESEATDNSRLSGKSSWSMPDLPFDQQLSWFQSYIATEKERSKRAQIIGDDSLAVAKEKLSESRPNLFDLRGNMQGTILVKYNSNRMRVLKRGGKKPAPESAIRSVADIFAKLSFEFDIQGEDCKFGMHSLGDLSAAGKFNGHKLEVSSTLLGGPNGFSASIKGSIDDTGRTSGFVYVKDASMSTWSPYIQGRSNLSGNLSVRLDIDGFFDDPWIKGRAVWGNGATLNGQHVRDAHGDFVCRNGRCSLDVKGRFGGRGRTSRQLEQSLDVGRSLFDDDDKEAEDTASSSDGTFRHGRQSGEPLFLSVSAPVRRYVLEYLQKSLSASLWKELESILHCGMEIGGDEIEVDINVRKYGFLLLSPVLSDLGWIDGSSDINLSVRGTLTEPVVAGRWSVADGKFWPSIFSRPIEGVRGEIIFEECGAVVARSIFGRSNGRPITISGSLPFSEKQLEVTRRDAAAVVSKEIFPDRLERKSQYDRRVSAVSRLERFHRGIVVDVSDVLLDLEDHFYGNVSGHITVKESLMNPCVSGSVALSRGSIYLASAPISPESALASMPAIFRQFKSAPGNGQDHIANRAPDDDQMTMKRSERKRGIDMSKGLRGRKETLHRGGSVPPKRDLSEHVLLTEPNSVIGYDKHVKLQDVKLVLGKDMQIVYPYLLNFSASGEVALDGTSAGPDLEGTLFFTHGEINLLTTKMRIKGGTESYVRFEKGREVTDPTVTLVLEDRDLQLQVKDAKASQCLERLKISDKRGDDLDESAWIEMVRSRLDEMQAALSSGRGIPSLAAKYLVNWYSLKGKLGSSNWRLYPTIVNSMGGFAGRESLEDIGAGFDLEVGKVTLSARGSAKGAKAGAVTFKPNDRLRVVLESDGPMTSSDVELRLSSDFRDPKYQVPEGETGALVIESEPEKAADSNHSGATSEDFSDIIDESDEADE